MVHHARYSSSGYTILVLLSPNQSRIGTPSQTSVLSVSRSIMCGIVFAEGLTPRKVSGETFARPCATWILAGSVPSTGLPAPIRPTSGKKQRDRLIRLAIRNPNWALGFADEVWWSRLAQPDMHTWQDADQVTRLQQLEHAKDDQDPKALACYGLLRRRRPQHLDQMLLRFVSERPLSAITTDFLALMPRSP